MSPSRKRSRKRTPEQIAADRKADADIDLFERISEFNCGESGWVYRWMGSLQGKEC